MIEKYRGFTIEKADYGFYDWVDYDVYDGPESNCYGFERSIEACREAIDEFLDEN